VNPVQGDRRGGLAKEVEHFSGWFASRIWSTRKGRAGTLVLSLILVLDSYSRIEAAVKMLTALPSVIFIIHTWWFNPLLILLGLGLLYWSSRQTKDRPLRKTIPERMDEAESSLKQLELAQLDTALPELNRRTMVLADVAQQIGPLSIWLSEITGLISEADQIARTFSQIQASQPKADVVMRPLSRWRPLVGSEPLNEGTRLGLAWAAMLQRHVARCNVSFLQACMTPAGSSC